MSSRRGISGCPLRSMRVANSSKRYRASWGTRPGLRVVLHGEGALGGYGKPLDHPVVQVDVGHDCAAGTESAATALVVVLARHLDLHGRDPLHRVVAAVWPKGSL